MNPDAEFHRYLWVRKMIEEPIDLSIPVNALSIKSAKFRKDARKLKNKKL